MPAQEKSTFSHFFKEDAKTIKDIVFSSNGQMTTPDKVGGARQGALPRLPAPGEAPATEFARQWQQIRAFFRSSNNHQGLPGGFTPVILSPAYTRSMISADYPLWVAGEDHDGTGQPCLSLTEVLHQSLAKFTPQGDSHILEKNVARIVHLAHEHLADGQPRAFKPAIKAILKNLAEQLDISGDEVKAFTHDLEHLQQHLPVTGTLLPYASNTVYALLAAASLTALGPRRKLFAQEVQHLKNKLEDLLRTEAEKHPGKKEPDAMGFAETMVDFDELAAMMPTAGPEPMANDRVQRIEQAVADLAAATALVSQQGFIFIDEHLHQQKHPDWEKLFANTSLTVYKQGEGSQLLQKNFAGKIKPWVTLLKAKRIGELELNNSYQPAIHDEYFAHFDWHNFTKEELNACPQFILIADEQELFTAELSKLTSLLTRNIPVKILAIKRDNYAQGNASAELHSQTELGALMLSHRNIYVAQATAIAPKYLFHTFSEGLSAFAPAFFSVLHVDAETHRNPHLWTSAAVESRDFPAFSFNGLLGTSWGSRFEVDDNPQPGTLWPVHTLEIEDSEGEKTTMDFPFTFADYAVLNPAYQHNFLPVAPAFWHENLIPLSEYMQGDAEANIGKVPFIWMADANAMLHKVAVSRQMVVAAQERLDFWRFLQENSGIDNYHATRAAEKTKAEMAAAHARDIAALQAEHEAEIQRVRDEEAEKVMENLTTVLLSLDTASIMPGSTVAPPIEKPAEPDSPTEAAAEADSEAEEESALTNDPYIDTALCTSCNECINLNGKMFQYNTDKMAFIADATAGTFSDLVEAAEKCPVDIIHPGTPLNPDEPGLDELLKRAEKYT